jgi:hypothetical protein
MTAGPQRPSGAASDIDYWLRRCEGFRVDSPDGRVGFVEEVRYASRCDRPDVIGVRAGLLGRLLLIVPIGEVAEILPREELVVLRRSPRPAAMERAHDLPNKVRPARGRRASKRPRDRSREPSESKPRQEVEAVSTRLTRLIGLRRRKGGEEEVTPDVEESAEPSAEEPSAEKQARDEPAAEEAPAEEAVAATPEEAAAEEPPAEEPPAEEQTTA